MFLSKIDTQVRSVRAKSLTATLVICSSLGGGVTGVGLQSIGEWPKLLGGTYVSSVGCTCENYLESGVPYHWITCPTKNLWGLNTTGWSVPETHIGSTCSNHGH